jgi:hypothetical protein
MADLFDCIHRSITAGECDDCGLCIGGSTNATLVDLTSGEGYSLSTAAKNPSFLADLKSLDIPEKVKSAALTLASSTNNEIHRMGVRKQLLFGFVYLAYLQLGHRLKPEELALKIGISASDLSQALRLVNGTSSSGVKSSEITAPVVVISPLDYIENYCYKYNLAKNIKSIIEYAEKILKADRFHQLLSRKPNDVAIAMIKHYVIINDIEMIKNFYILDISSNILKQRLKDISDIYDHF